jgi:hypothetical protein
MDFATTAKSVIDHSVAHCPSAELPMDRVDRLEEAIEKLKSQLVRRFGGISWWREI